MSRKLNKNVGQEFIIRGRSKNAEIKLNYHETGKYTITYKNPEGEEIIETLDKTREAWARAREIAKSGNVARTESTEPSEKKTRAPRKKKVVVAAATETENTTPAEPVSQMFFDVTEKKRVSATVEAKRENNGRCYVYSTSASGKVLCCQIKKEVYDTMNVPTK
jgi:hypothetical protein